MNRSPNTPVVTDLITAAATVLSDRPFATVSLEDIAEAAGTSVPVLSDSAGDLRMIASQILTYEGGSMRAAQAKVKSEPNPLQRLIRVFRIVGENLRDDIIVRAGVRLANESYSLFPERNINPGRTWASFLTTVFEEAEELNLLRAGITPRAMIQVSTAVGLGTKDLIYFSNAWSSAPVRFEEAGVQLIELCTEPDRDKKRSQAV